MSTKSVAVRIAGHEYKILAEGDGASLRQIAADVDRAMKRVRDRTGTVDTLDVAVLTCLNLAREIIELRSQLGEAALDERMRGLIERVEALLPDSEVATTDTVMAPDADKRTNEQTAQGSADPETARTLDLPNFEALRGRSSSAKEADVASANESMPQQRVAAGGRERAS